MILGLELTFKIKGKRKIAKSIEFKKGLYYINGTKKYKRIPLKKKDLKGFNFKKKKVRAYSDYPFWVGRYKVKFNGKNYYMTYLDELELFKQAVVQLQW